MIDKAFVTSEEGAVARVTFTLPDSVWADEIYLVGDFNDWSRSSHPFHQGREGDWSLTVDLELGRAYQFRYLRDGRDWMNDSQADCKDTRRRAAALKEKGLHFVDVGTSGGVWGLAEGYSLMIGGEQEAVEYLRPVLETLAPARDQGWGHVGPSGAAISSRWCTTASSMA